MLMARLEWHSEMWKALRGYETRELRALRMKTSCGEMSCKRVAGTVRGNKHSGIVEHARTVLLGMDRSTESN